MFDFNLSIDDEHLPYGAILEGSTKPSDVLEAILPFLQWAAYKTAEWGADYIDAMSQCIIAEGLHKLARSSAHYDVSMVGDPDDPSEDEVEVLALHYAVGRFIEVLDEFTAIGQRFGFDDGDLGVWTDWDTIDNFIKTGEIIEIDHPDDLDDLKDAGPRARFALLDTDEELTLFSLQDLGTPIWSI